MVIDVHGLQSTVLCEHLAAADLDEFRLRSKDTILLPNQSVYKIGENISSTYLILEGNVLVFIPDCLGNPIVIDRFKAGDIFGELVTSKEVACSSTAVTTAHTHLLILDQDNLSFLFAKKPEAVLILIKTLNRHWQHVHSLLRNSRASRSDERNHIDH